MVVTPPVTQTPTMVEVALDRPPQPTAYSLGLGQGAIEPGVMDRTIKGLAQGGRAQPIGGTQILSTVLGARGWATWPGNALPQHQLKPAQGELRACGSPPLAKATLANCRPHTFPPQPWTKTSQH